MNKIIQIIADELNVKEEQVTNTIKLIDDGNTIPFIARYRKEVTGGLSDEILRDLDERLKYLRNLEERKQEVIKSIDGQGKLTDEIVQSLENAKTLSEVEDIYRPYKQKKKTRATIAKAKGLEPLALIIFEQNDKRNIEEIAKEFIDEEKGVLNVEEAIQGAKDIIAENISDNPNYRKQIKRMCYREGIIMVKGTKEEKSAYDMYYNFNEKVNRIPSHRILAINRGEKEEFLKVKMEKPETTILEMINKDIIKGSTQYTKMLEETIEDSFKRLIEPSIEREIRSDLTEKAETQAIKVFGKNAKPLLLAAPLKGLTVMGFDPAYRTGCKIAVIDETGKLLATTTVYPTEPQNDVEGAKKELIALIKEYNVNIIAIGNGTASRESETFVAEMIKEIPEIIDMGVESLKIEGRLKTEYYLASVVNAYRNAIDDYMKNPNEYDYNKYLKELEKTKTRGLTTFYFNDRNNKDFQEYDGKQYNPNFEFGGKVLENQANKTLIEIRNKLSIGDKMEILIPGKIEVEEFTIQKMWDSDTEEEITTVNPGKQGQTVKLELPIEAKTGWILRRRK